MLPNREAMDRSVCPPLGQTPGRGGRLNSFRETGWRRVAPVHDEPDVRCEPLAAKTDTSNAPH